ncbi:MAG: enoyl-CoA hydratase-related protein [Clostridia bacterium]
MSNKVKIDKRDNVYILTINRPEALNALNEEVLTDLNEAIDIVIGDETARAVIITGEGRAFVAGADIGAQAVLDIEGGRKWGQNGSALFRKIEKMDIPVIAAVNGFALGGGCELALACDLITASTKAKFGQPEVGLGIIPGFSGTQRLPRRIGIAKAKELIYTGRMIKAEEAEKIGLVNQVSEPETLISDALALAAEITKNAPLAVKYAKAAVSRGMEVDIDNGIAVENELFAMCFGSEDQKEGMHAFLEKRQADFKNR